MLQQEKPEDFVIATGEMHSVREFVEESFKYVGQTIVWKGEGNDEVGIEAESGIVRVKVNQKYFRPTEVVSVVTVLLSELSMMEYESIFSQYCRIFSLETRLKPASCSTGSQKFLSRLVASNYKEKKIRFTFLYFNRNW